MSRKRELEIVVDREDGEASPKRRPDPCSVPAARVRSHTELMRSARFALKHVFGHDGFRAMQEEVVAAIFRRESCFVILPTGGGKSLCYQLPAVVLPGLAVVVSPLLSLIEDQVMSLMRASCGGVPAAYLTSSLKPAQEDAIFRDIQSDTPTCKLLFVTPERMDLSERFGDALRRLKARGLLSFVAIDEAHCVSEWGHDFRKSYLEMGKRLSRLVGSVPVMALTATVTPTVRASVTRLLKVPNFRVFQTTFNRENLFYEVLTKPKSGKETLERVAGFIETKHPAATGIVYCLSRKETEEMAAYLHEKGIAVDFYHAGMTASQRQVVQVAWLRGDLRVVCATIAYGMGIDHPNVRFVVHATIAKSIEGYYQESGRAGRDGEPADCVLFFKPTDVTRVKRLIDKDKAGKTRTVRERNKKLVEDVQRYCEDKDTCRRKLLLEHFNEKFTSAQCRYKCDTCRAGQGIAPSAGATFVD